MTKSQLACVLQVNDSETPPQCVCFAVAPVNVSHIFYSRTFCTFTLQKWMVKRHCFAGVKFLHWEIRIQIVNSCSHWTE